MRPFRDSDTEVTIHWYKVPATNPRLPYPSRINSLDWRDYQINPGPVGEVTGAEREFDGWLRIVPPIPTDHLCGSREDFELGGSISGPGPPLVRDRDGIPTCCREPLKGLVMGGIGLVAPVTTYGGGQLVMGGVGLITRDPHSYVTNIIVGPGFGGEFKSELPLSDSFLWLNASFPDSRLTNTAVRGTVGTWRLEWDGGPSVWQATWDGLGLTSLAWVSGPYTAPMTIFLAT